MSDNRIIVNGRHYDSPDAMPPDVRRTYEDAMRLTRSSNADATVGDASRVVIGHSGRHVSGDLVVDRTVVHRSGSSPDGMPADIARQGAARPRTGVHVSLRVERPHSDDATRPTLPVEDSDLEARIRGIPVRLAIALAVVVFLLWLYFGR
jgi:hypothetical protein